MRYSNIVIVDDDPDDREIFAEACKDVSSLINCKTFNDGESALEKLTQAATAPDLIFLDLNMPRMNGMEFLLQARKHQSLKDIPVIIYSTSAYMDAFRLELPATAYINKPHDYFELVELLKKFITT